MHNILEEAMNLIHSIHNFMSQHHLFLVNFTCFVAFSIQLTSVITGFLDRTQTNINKHEEDLLGKNFPIMIKICINPGFNDTAIIEAGYKNIFDFFVGRSKYNKSVYGWAGHTKDGGVVDSVKNIKEAVTLHTAQNVLNSINIWSITAEDFNINLDLVRIGLMNYPYNCFTLDLSNNTMVKKKGIRQIFFYFPLLENYSAQIYLQGKSLACNREIKSHKFFSSGPDIKLLDLGKIYTNLAKRLI